MESTSMWLAHQRAIEARREAGEDRLARQARGARRQRPSMLDRVRGRHR
jgi:hypothetical protein